MIIGHKYQPFRHGLVFFTLFSNGIDVEGLMLTEVLLVLFGRETMEGYRNNYSKFSVADIYFPE